MNPDDYTLSEVELDRIFIEVIAPARFRQLVSSESPVLILIGAQPGAGKTRAGREAMAASGQKVVPIVGDDLRSFHPQYVSLLELSPADMPSATAQASSAWVERSIDFAAEHRISVLVEGTFRNPGVPIATARRFKDAGFSVHAILVAVPPEVSRASIAGRYVEDAARDGQARFTSVGSHNYAFRMLPTTLSALAESESPVDRLTVRTRDATLFDKHRRGTSPIRGALAPAQSAWTSPIAAFEIDSLISSLEVSLDYFSTHLPDDDEAQQLVRQLRLDHEYLDLSRGGTAVVRGYLRGADEVRPHLRSRPSYT